MKFSLLLSTIEKSHSSKSRLSNRTALILLHLKFKWKVIEWNSIHPLKLDSEPTSPALKPTDSSDFQLSHGSFYTARFPDLAPTLKMFAPTLR